MRFNSLCLGLAAAAALFAAGAQAAVVEFHIRAGTAPGSWNTRAELVTVRIGDSLRLINDDSVIHALHTSDGIPCDHGSDMAPHGGSYDCVIAEPYDSLTDGALIDHYFHDARFWLVVAP